MGLVGAVGAAEQAVRLASVNQHSPDQCVVAAHFRESGVPGEPLSTSKLIVLLRQPCQQGLVVHTDHLVILAFGEPQAQLPDPGADDLGVADELRIGQTLFDSDLHDPKHALGICRNNLFQSFS